MSTGTDTTPPTWATSIAEPHQRGLDSADKKEEPHPTILNESYTPSNGVKIPKLGLGTWFIDDSTAAQAVHDAVEIGYRNVDTAQAYATTGAGSDARSGRAS